MLNRKVIYLSALFLCTQDTIGNYMDVDAPNNSPTRKMLDEDDEKEPTEAYIDQLLKEKKWEGIEGIMDYYYEHVVGHPENMVKGLIWDCLAGKHAISSLKDGRPEISEEVRMFVSGVKWVEFTATGLVEFPEETSGIRQLLKKIIKFDAHDSEELITKLNSIMTENLIFCIRNLRLSVYTERVTVELRRSGVRC